MKKIISLLVVLAMLVAIVPAVFAADEGTTVYLAPGEWAQYRENYAVYYFNSVNNNSGWVLMSYDETSGYQTATVPADYDKVIFVGLKSGTSLNWNNKENQTVDLTLPTDGNNLFTIENPWDGNQDWKATGTWSTYTPPVAAAPLTDGDNNVTVGEFTYTATQTGTLFVTFKSVTYVSSWGESSIGYEQIEYYFGYSGDEPNWFELTVNGKAVENAYYGSVDVTQGDVVSLSWGFLGANETVQSWTMSGVLNLNYEKYAFPEAGSAEMPVSLNYGECPTSSIAVAPGATAYYDLDFSFYGATLNVYGDNLYVMIPKYDDYGWPVYDNDGNQVWDRIDAVDGVVSIPVQSRGGMTVQLGNSGTEETTFWLYGYFAAGTMNNPAQLANGDNSVAIDAYTQYYYVFEAICDTTLTVTIDTEKCSNWAINYYNDAYTDSGYSTSNDENAVSSYTIVAPMGDKITIVLWTADYAAGEIILNVDIDCPHDYADYVCSICGAIQDRVYENQAQIDPEFSLTVGANATVEYVDVTQKHTAVLGEDGFYHLDSEDGPIIYVDLYSDLFCFGTAIDDSNGTGQIYIYVYGEDGSLVKDNNGNNLRYNATAAIQEYLDAADENGYYPLTEDLAYFYQNYGKSQGWYIPGMSFILGDDFDADTGWMFACCYLVDENPGTGDNSMLSVAIAAAIVSAMTIVALPVAKKHF